MKRILFAAAFGLATLTAAHAATDPKETWREVEPSVSKLLDARAKQNFEPLGKIGGPRAQHVKKLMENAVDILAASPNAKDREVMASLQHRIAAAQKKIANLRFEMASAPDAPPGFVESALASLGLGEPNKATYQAEIAATEKDVQKLQAELTKVKERFSTDLAEIGIQLTGKQIDGLLAMATADDIIDMQVAFENMKAVNQALLDATIRTDESLDVARRYYGIYAVLLEIALAMHDEFVANVDNNYLPELKKLEDETKRLNEESRSLLQKEKDESLRKVLGRNVSAQELTLKVARIYRDQLNEQRARVNESANRLRSQHRVAINTYRTVETSADLVVMMRSTGKAFDSLMKLEIPPLRPFESIEMQAEFEKITNQLKGKPGV